MSPSAADSEGTPLADNLDWQLLRRLAAYLKQQPRLFGLAALLYPLQALFVALPPYLVQRILDEAVPQKNTKLLFEWSGLYFLALAAEYGAMYSSQFTVSVLGQRAIKKIRTDLFSHLMRLPAAFFDRQPTGRLLTRLTNDVEALAEIFSTGAISLVGDLLTVLAIFSMMFFLSPKWTLYSLLVLPLLLIIVLTFRRYARQAFRDIRKHLARLNTFLAEHLNGMSVVQVFRQQIRTQQEFASLNDDFRAANRTAILFDALLFAAVEALATASVALLLWSGSYDLSTHIVGTGTFVAFMQYIRRFFVPIRDLSSQYTIMQSGFAAAERCFLLLDEPITISSSAPATPLASFNKTIELQKVWFTYDSGKSPWVLQDFDLTIHRGEHLAIVGTTGSGKSTLAKLINRTYEIQRGTIRVDGHDIRDVDLGSLRRLFAYVPQDVYLFTGTIFDNLRLGSTLSDDELKNAARIVQAEKIIERLPKGYNTPVQELGQNFSAGERQLIAFARALATNPQILVLDEATSHVDSTTEHMLQNALDAIMTGRTALIIAHRLATVRKADRIVVLDQGKIVQQGSHAELSASPGPYLELLRAML